MNAKHEQMIRQYDEAMTTMLRTLPDSLKSFYDKLLERGFDRYQAFQLTRDFLQITLTPRT